MYSSQASTEGREGAGWCIHISREVGRLSYSIYLDVAQQRSYCKYYLLFYGSQWMYVQYCIRIYISPGSVTKRCGISKSEGIGEYLVYIYIPYRVLYSTLLHLTNPGILLILSPPPLSLSLSLSPPSVPRGIIYCISG